MVYNTDSHSVEERDAQTDANSRVCQRQNPSKVMKWVKEARAEMFLRSEEQQYMKYMASTIIYTV